jgi:hypothetical protein
MIRASSSQKRQQWLERMERYSASGLTVAAFCVAESISIPSFYQWRRKLSPAIETDQGNSPESGKQRFLAVRIATPTQLEVYLPNGTKICLAGGDATLVDAVIAAAGRVPSVSRGEEAAC